MGSQVLGGRALCFGGFCFHPFLTFEALNRHRQARLTDSPRS